MLRELCYDQDLCLLQKALIVLPLGLVIVSILDRFGLLAYFRGTSYEGAQLGSMVEEVFCVNHDSQREWQCWGYVST